MRGEYARDLPMLGGTSDLNLPENEKRGAVAPRPLTSYGFLGFTQNAIDRGAAHRALALRHTTTRVRNVHDSFELTLLFAFNAVGLTLICFSHYFLRSSQVLLPANALTIPPRHAQTLAIHAQAGRFLPPPRSISGELRGFREIWVNRERFCPN